MGSMTPAGRNTAVDAWKAAYTYVGLFEGDPEATGVEVAGGTPAYARQQVVWGISVDGDIAMTGEEVFEIPTGGTFDHFGVFTAVTGGTLGAKGTLTPEAPYDAPGQYRLTGLTIDID